MMQFDDHIFRMGWFNTQLDHYNNIWHLGFAPQRHGPCSRKAGALHGLLWVPGGFVPQVPMASMIFTAWKTPFRAGKMPCPRIGPEGSCWMGSWMDGEDVQNRWSTCKNVMPSWEKTHIYPKGIFQDVFFLNHFLMVGMLVFCLWMTILYCNCITFAVIVSSLFVYSRYLFMTV